jgi:uncharacterized phiE125 gp8 family phage protein
MSELFFADGPGPGAGGETRALEPGLPALTLDEAKEWLRITTASEDATIAALVRAASDMCEAFIGQYLIERACRSTVPADGRWQRLGAVPVRTIGAAERIARDGGATAIGEKDYARDIAADGDGWVRYAGGGAISMRVDYRAGLASDADSVPEALRQGLLRLVAHLYASRDGRGETTPPAAVIALWRPWRRMRL